jgi:hypothetical protein
VNDSCSCVISGWLAARLVGAERVRKIDREENRQRWMMIEVFDGWIALPTNRMNGVGKSEVSEVWCSCSGGYCIRGVLRCNGRRRRLNNGVCCVHKMCVSWRRRSNLLKGRHGRGGWDDWTDGLVSSGACVEGVAVRCKYR